jgi:hypothetical protein
MHSILLSPATLAAARSTAPAASSDPGAALLAAARLLVAGLERDCTIEPQTLRNAISAAFDGSDAAGAWNWKTAYDACEAAQILFLRKFGPAMRKRAASPSAFLVMLEKLAALVPSHMRCSDEGQALQHWRDSFVQLQERSRLLFSAPIGDRVYARHNTTTATRLTVVDLVAADDPTSFPTSPGAASDAGMLLDWVTALVPPRPAMTAAAAVTPMMQRIAPRIRAAQRILPSRTKCYVAEVAQAAVELTYESINWTPESGGRITDALYGECTLQSIRVPGAQPHPTRLVQSGAMASVAPPSYRPDLPPAVITDGLLSDAQLESVIYAGEAHARFLAGAWMVDETFDVVSAASDDADHTVRFRGGWFLGDGTGAGKGRQVAGILLDNWLKGRRRAVWISKSDKLIQDAQRDWAALGQERLLITPLSRFRPGSPIRLEQGILFTTYATLRSDGREEKLSRVQQIIDWLRRDFDGKIVFDESHAMQNAAGEKSERGERAPSLQGRAGLRLQHALPNARVLFYVWATGATTVHNLAHASARALGRSRLPVRHPCGVRRGHRRRRRRRHGGTRPRPQGARSLYRPLAFIRGHRIRAPRALARRRAGSATLAPADAIAAALDGRTVLQPQDGLELRGVKVMREFRVELSEFSDGMVERLKAIGLISEIISWKLRLFVPTGTAGPAILATLMERHPLIRLADKTAA